jgi:hypothetical protein
MCKHCIDIALLFVVLTVQAAFAKVVKVGVVQTVIEDTLNSALRELCKEADSADIYVIVGMPYQTSIVKSAGWTETMICATRKTSTRNDMDITGYRRNQNRRNRAQTGWYEWMKRGALLIEKDADVPALSNGRGPAAESAQTPAELPGRRRDFVLDSPHRESLPDFAGCYCNGISRGDRLHRLRE